MPKDDAIEVVGTIKELLPSTTFRAELENGQLIIVYLGGRLKKNKIRITLNDKVRIELSPYDLTKGRIVHRL
jgi:translation initiation factor IF-1